MIVDLPSQPPLHELTCLATMEGTEGMTSKPTFGPQDLSRREICHVCASRPQWVGCQKLAIPSSPNVHTIEVSNLMTGPRIRQSLRQKSEPQTIMMLALMILLTMVLKDWSICDEPISRPSLEDNSMCGSFNVANNSLFHKHLRIP